MRLEDVRRELERRSLSTKGDREALESRLQYALNDELGFNALDGLDLNGNDKVDTEAAVQSKEKEFKFGVIGLPEMHQDKRMDVDESNEYEPRDDFLPLNPESNNGPSIGSRLGSAPVRNILDRIKPCVRNIKDRLEYPKCSLVSDSLESQQSTEKVDSVFSEEHRKARAKRFAVNNRQAIFTRKVVEIRPTQPSEPTLPRMEVFQEYDIEKMEERAQKLAHCPTHIPTLKRRARRFEEECANELAQVTVAKNKNNRFKRFKLGDGSSSEEEEEEEEI